MDERIEGYPDPYFTLGIPNIKLFFIFLIFEGYKRINRTVGELPTIEITDSTKKVATT